MADDDVSMEEVLEVWDKLKPPLKKLHDDVICSIPDTKVKDSVRKKFTAAENPLKAALREQIGELKAKFSQPSPDEKEDHSQCHQRISELEGIVATKDAAIQSEQDKVQAYTGTIKLLRDELQKKGAIRPSLNERLRDLGFCRSALDTASASSSTPSMIPTGRPFRP